MRQETRLPLPPGFWVVDRSVGDLVFQFREGSPRHCWDPNTQIMHPEPSFAQGTKRLSALLMTQVGSAHLNLIVEISGSSITDYVAY